MSQSKGRLNPLLVACIMTFLFYLGSFMKNPILPLFATDLGASITVVGLITFSFMGVASLLSMPLGLTSDWLGRRRLVVSGSLVATITFFLLAFTNHPYQIILVNIVSGFGMAAYGPAMFSFVGDVSRAGRFGRAYGAYTLAQQIAMALGPAVGGLVADLVGYRQTFVCSGVLVSLAAIVGLTSFPHGTSEQSLLNRKEITQTFKILYHERIVLFSWGTVFCFYFMYGIAPPFLPLYAKNVGLSVPLIAALFTVQSSANAASRLVFGAFYDRVKKAVPSIMVSLIIGAIATAVLTSFKDMVSLIVLMGIIGICFGITTMVASASIAEATTPASRGLAMGIFNGCFYGAMAVSPALLGPVISRYGFQLGFWSAAATGLVGSLLVCLMTRTAK